MFAFARGKSRAFSRLKVAKRLKTSSHNGWRHVCFYSWVVTSSRASQRMVWFIMAVWLCSSIVLLFSQAAHRILSMKSL